MPCPAQTSPICAYIYYRFLRLCARVGPPRSGGGGLSGRGENSTDGADSAFGNGRVGRFGPHSPHGQDHHPWALLSGDVRIRKVSLAVAKTSVSFLEGWYRVSGPLLGRRDAAAGVPGRSWSLKAGVVVMFPKSGETTTLTHAWNRGVSKLI